MGAVRWPLRDFYDATTEIVGIKSGLLLNRFQVRDILLPKHDEDYLKSDNMDASVRVRVDSLESMLVDIRQRIGNLPAVLPTKADYLYLHEYGMKTGDWMVGATSTGLGTHYLNLDSSITKEILADIFQLEYGLDDYRLCQALANIAWERNDLSCLMPSKKDWDGGTELSKLFNCEVKSEKDFLEQKFIDYLAVNGHEIELIHWRNFERFVAEYFKKQGYEVKLGPGSNDGGVDIRIYKSGSDALEFLIQCKRHKASNKVDIETVKSFYTDVKFEDATEGIIATTGYVAPGGKKVCQTRGYNIRFAENENVKKWAKDMWTFK
jgi:restriction system protein